MAEKGVVIELKSNLAVVKMVRTEACAKCRACLAGMNEQEMLIEAENACEAKINDWVELELRDNGFFNAVLIMYGIPFIALITGILLGYYVLIPTLKLGVNSELFSFGVGLVFMLGAFLGIRSQENRWESNKYRPIAMRITDGAEE